MQYQKAKSAAKIVHSNSKKLESLIANTLRQCSDVVGSTLGPGGLSVLIERQEDLPPLVTKDGVTVFRALGFLDPTAQVILEAARDSAIRTANEAGDGPQPLWAKVLTPNGFISMADVTVGTEICGTNKTTQKVLGVYPKGEMELFKVTFGDQQVVECSANHLWQVTTSYGVQKVLTTQEMLADFKTQTKNGFRYKYFVPKTVVEFDSKNSKLPLDPYLVGVLLGDGSLSDTGSIELSLGMSKAHILDKIKLPDGMYLKTTFVKEKNCYRVKIQGNVLKLRKILDQLGLRNKDSHTKRIPEQYLFADENSRLALLQGLIDTDGYVNTRNRFEFSTVSPGLSYDFVALCRSLGKSVYKNIYTKRENSFSKKPIFRITELKGYRYGNKIVDIVKTNKVVKMQCIKVSNPDHLYITDGFVPTHNTTTATILAEAFVSATNAFCRANSKVSPQRVVREVENAFKTVIEPTIKRHSLKFNWTEENKKNFRAVARVSANGDEALANSVIECFDLVGDEGNVTILEFTGPSKYEVERLDGFGVPIGYEDCCGPFYQKFINDTNAQSCQLDNPLFVLYYGQIRDISICSNLFEKIINAANGNVPNIVLVATGFSETVLAHLAVNFSAANKNINVYPLLVPMAPTKTGQHDFLQDLAALTGGKIFDLIQKPLDTGSLHDLGSAKTFESSRFRSNIMIEMDEKTEISVFARVDELHKQLDSVATSELDKQLLKERIGKLTGGIAKLKIYGSSSGELREKRDRAEDAICAVRGALQHGTLPAGGYTLLMLSKDLEAWNSGSSDKDKIYKEVLAKALIEPVYRLYKNAGYSPAETKSIIDSMWAKMQVSGEPETYDLLNSKMVVAYEAGLLDSTPAVLEAIRNSISIATLLGTCGGTVVFGRDLDLERKESIDTKNFLQDLNSDTSDPTERP